jgi:hypothetical protein
LETAHRRFPVFILVSIFFGVANVSLVGATETSEEEQEIDPSLGVVIEAQGTLDASVLSAVTREARSTLVRLDYRIASQQATYEAIGRLENVKRTGGRYRDGELLRLGESMGAGLVVFPRVVGQFEGKILVETVVARTEKGMVWRCARSLSPDRPIPKAAVEALHACLLQLLTTERPEESEDDDEEDDEEKDKEKEKLVLSKERYLGISGAIIPWGVQTIHFYYTDEEGVAKHWTPDIDYGLSGNIGLFFERRMLSWMAVGVMGEYFMLWGEGAKKDKENFSAERLAIIGLGMTARILYPGKWIEPYLKLVLGLALCIPPDEEQNHDLLLEAGIGANYQARVGTMLTLPYVGLFAEAGVYYVPWFPSMVIGTVLADSVMAREAGVLFNFGAVFTF